MNSDDKRKIDARVLLTGIFFSLLFTVIGARAAFIQVVKDSWYQERARREYEKPLTLMGKRGTIYDTNYRELAVSVEVPSVAANPSMIARKDRHRVSRQLAEALHVKADMILSALSKERKFVWIKRKATPKEAQAARSLNIRGVHFLTEHNRVYPNKNIAAQVLGFSGIDGRGLEGLEFSFDQYLKGGTDSITIQIDAYGRPFEAEKTREASYSGKNVVLTIDGNIQYITEQALEEAVNAYSAKSGMAIVISPKTGAVLALANAPLFNPNNYARFDRERWRNRVVTDSFEPGSTMKIFSVAAALESGTSSPDSIYFCENGAYRIGPNTVRDTHPYGWLSLQQIVKYSSNIGAIKVSENTGKAILYQTLKKFGFGSPCGIECPGETDGSLSHYKRWYRIDAGNIAFGQGVAVSAVQLAAATAAIANGGVLMKPYLVKAVTDLNGRPIKRYGPEKIRRVVSEETAQALIRMMKTVVEDGGTGVNAALEGYKVCGKTGTAQKIENGRYSRRKYISSFIGFAPMENPEAVVLVVVDEPQKRYYGGTVAAPAFKKIAQGTLAYLNIQPKKGQQNPLTVSL